jgi:hypothetical protein
MSYIYYVFLKINLNSKMTQQITRGKVFENIVLVTIGVEKRLARGTINSHILINCVSQI